MKNNIVKSLALISLLASFSSFAGESAAMASEGQIYAQIESGLTKMNINPSDLTSVSTDAKQGSFSIRGGYEFPSETTGHIAIEAGYLYLGKYRFNGVYYYGYPPFNLEVKQQGFDILAVLKTDINQSVSLFAKTGLAYIDLTTTASGVNVVKPYEDSYSNLLPELAAGIAVKINEKLSLTGTVSHLFESNESFSISSTSAAIGLRVNFN